MNGWCRKAYGVIEFLVFFAALFGAAQAAYPPLADLSVSKLALENGSPVSEINPGQTFYYNITATNNGPNAAPEVVVTDKLPYDVLYTGTVVAPSTPVNYTIQRSGDLIYVTFDLIPAHRTRYINITVRSPADAPTTLYNIVNLRYGNDPDLSNNNMTLSTYVPEVGYNQTAAAKSFEDLLHNQSQLLFQFEDLLHTLPQTQAENYTFMASFEQLLRISSQSHQQLRGHTHQQHLHRLEYQLHSAEQDLSAQELPDDAL